MYFKGVHQSDGTEFTEIISCSAFPNGIPDDIAYGENKHEYPVGGDNGIQYKRISD